VQFTIGESWQEPFLRSLDSRFIHEEGAKVTSIDHYFIPVKLQVCLIAGFLSIYIDFKIVFFFPKPALSRMED
jgi:hypothetical protein